MSNKKVVYNSSRDRIEIIRPESDPNNYIVRHWRKFFFFKKLKDSVWFIDPGQAETYAKEQTASMKKDA